MKLAVCCLLLALSSFALACPFVSGTYFCNSAIYVTLLVHSNGQGTYHAEYPNGVCVRTGEVTFDSEGLQLLDGSCFPSSNQCAQAVGYDCRDEIYTNLTFNEECTEWVAFNTAYQVNMDCVLIEEVDVNDDDDKSAASCISAPALFFLLAAAFFVF